MQTVSSLFSGSGGGYPVSYSGDLPQGASIGDATSGYGGSGPSSGSLASLRVGTSAISAISSYAMAQNQAQALNMEASDETLAANEGYIQAKEKTNAINLDYTRTVGAQLSAAAAGGIDIGSGSVQEATRQSGQTAMRQQTIINNSAQLNAQQRLSRAAMLRNSAQVTQTAGMLSSLTDLAKAGAQVAML